VWSKTGMNGQVFCLGFLELKGSHFQEVNGAPPPPPKQ